jgi:hypothetical protein
MANKPPREVKRGGYYSQQAACISRPQVSHWEANSEISRQLTVIVGVHAWFIYTQRWISADLQVKLNHHAGVFCSAIIAHVDPSAIIPFVN